MCATVRMRMAIFTKIVIKKAYGVDGHVHCSLVTCVHAGGKIIAELGNTSEQ